MQMVVGIQRDLQRGVGVGEITPEVEHVNIRVSVEFQRVEGGIDVLHLCADFLGGIERREDFHQDDLRLGAAHPQVLDAEFDAVRGGGSGGCRWQRRAGCGWRIRIQASIGSSNRPLQWACQAYCSRLSRSTGENLLPLLRRGTVQGFVHSKCISRRACRVPSSLPGIGEGQGKGKYTASPHPLASSEKTRAPISQSVMFR